ncbi:hypothetical protein [Halococcus dombrowskii]
MDNGAVVPSIAKVYPLADATDAHNSALHVK